MIEKFKTNAEVIENGDKYLYGNHVRMPISMERGEGVYVFDKDGNKYLDFVGGIAVNGLGHCHPAIVKCLQERAETILHCSNYFYNEPAVQTAKLIVDLFIFLAADKFIGSCIYYFNVFDKRYITTQVQSFVSSSPNPLPVPTIIPLSTHHRTASFAQSGILSSI